MDNNPHPVTTDELRHELQHYATKADLYQMENRLVRWMIAVMLGGMGVAATVTLAVQKLFT